MPPTLLHSLYFQGPRGTWISSKSPLMGKVKGNLYFQYPRGDRSNNTHKVKRNSGGSMDCGWVWSSVIGKLTANNKASGMGKKTSLELSYVNVGPVVTLELLLLLSLSLPLPLFSFSFFSFSFFFFFISFFKTLTAQQEFAVLAFVRNQVSLAHTTKL